MLASSLCFFCLLVVCKEALLCETGIKYILEALEPSFQHSCRQFPYSRIMYDQGCQQQYHVVNNNIISIACSSGFVINIDHLNAKGLCFSNVQAKFTIADDMV